MNKKQLFAFIVKLNLKIDRLILEGKDYSQLAKLHKAALRAYEA